MRKVLVLAQLLPFTLCLLTGCSEVEERLVLDGRGGGSYALVVRWNADLWRRVGEHLPKAVRRRLDGHPFPLSVAAWRDGLEGLEGVEIVSLEARDKEGGWRELAVELRFRSLPDLFRWEVLARRSMKLVIEEQREGVDAVRIARLEMDPIPFVPVLDPLAALLAAVERPPPLAEGLRSLRDPPPLRRFGLDRAKAEELWQFAGPAVAKAQLSFRVEVPGALLEVAGRPGASGERADFVFDFGALRAHGTDRRLRLAWRVRSVDEPTGFVHDGETRAGIEAGLER